jgi:hypothetical protein
MRSPHRLPVGAIPTSLTDAAASASYFSFVVLALVEIAASQGQW